MAGLTFEATVVRLAGLAAAPGRWDQELASGLLIAGSAGAAALCGAGLTLTTLALGQRRSAPRRLDVPSGDSSGLPVP